MTERRRQIASETTPILRCPSCGNQERFIEVVKHEAHIVDGNLNYLHLLDAEADHYLRCQCDEIIDADAIMEG